MVRQQEIDDRIEHFVQAMLQVVRDVRENAVRAVGAAASARAGQGKATWREPPKARRAPVAVKPTRAPVAASTRAPVPAIATPSIAAAPAVEPGGQGTSDRQEVVLAAVRTLVRAGAADVARHAGLANGTTAVVLKALVAAGRVAKVDGKYGLVSAGTVKPFKRARG